MFKQMTVAESQQMGALSLELRTWRLSSAVARYTKLFIWEASGLSKKSEN